MRFSAQVKKVLLALGMLAMFSGQLLSAVHAYEHLDSHEEARECIDCPALDNFKHVSVSYPDSTARPEQAPVLSCFSKTSPVIDVSLEYLIRAPPDPSIS